MLPKSTRRASRCEDGVAPVSNAPLRGCGRREKSEQPCASGASDPGCRVAATTMCSGSIRQVWRGGSTTVEPLCGHARLTGKATPFERPSTTASSGYCGRSDRSRKPTSVIPEVCDRVSARPTDDMQACAEPERLEADGPSVRSPPKQSVRQAKNPCFGPTRRTAILQPCQRRVSAKDCARSDAALSTPLPSEPGRLAFGRPRRLHRLRVCPVDTVQLQSPWTPVYDAIHGVVPVAM